jgi:hypothetical protein
MRKTSLYVAILLSSCATLPHSQADAGPKYEPRAMVNEPSGYSDFDEHVAAASVKMNCYVADRTRDGVSDLEKMYETDLQKERDTGKPSGADTMLLSMIAQRNLLKSEDARCGSAKREFEKIVNARGDADRKVLQIIENDNVTPPRTMYCVSNSAGADTYTSCY